MGESESFAISGSDQLGTERFVQDVEQAIFFLAWHLTRLLDGGHQLGEVEGFAQHGGALQYLDAFRADLIQSPPNGLFDALRHCQIGDGPGLPFAGASVNLASLDQRFDHLFDEEGIALRLAIDGMGQVGRYLFLAQHGSHQRSTFVERQAVKLNPGGQPFAVPVHQRGGQRVLAAQLDFTISAQNQEALVPQPAKQVVHHG